MNRVVPVSSQSLDTAVDWPIPAVTKTVPHEFAVRDVQNKTGSSATADVNEFVSGDFEARSRQTHAALAGPSDFVVSDCHVTHRRSKTVDSIRQHVSNGADDTAAYDGVSFNQNISDVCSARPGLHHDTVA